MAYDILSMFDFSGGVNQSVAIDNMAANELQRGENIDLYARGGFSSRDGIDLDKQVGEGRIDKILELEYINPDNKRVLKRLVFTGGKLLDYDTGDVVKDNIGAYVDYEVYKNKMYLLANEKYWEYDGTTIKEVTCTETDSNLDIVKKCKYIAQRGQRLFATGHPTQPNALFFSEPGRPEYFKQLSVVNATTDDADVTTGLKEYHGALLVFKTRSIFAWFGYDPKSDVEFQRLNTHTGTRAINTVINVANYLFFLGSDNRVYALLGREKDVISTVDIGKNINPMLDKIVYKADHSLNPHCAVYIHDKYLLSVPTDNPDVCDLVVVLYGNRIRQDYSAPAVIYTGWNVNCWIHSLDDTLYSGSGIANGNIYKHFTGALSDNGEDIPVVMRTAYMDSKLSDTEYIKNKKYRRGYLVLKQYIEIKTGTIKITPYVDGVLATSMTGEITEVSPDEALIWDLREWDIHNWDYAEVVTRRFDIRAKGKRMEIEFTTSINGTKLEVYGFGIEFKIKKPDRR